MALILYIYYEDQVENCLNDALKLVSLAEVFVVCSRKETLKKEGAGAFFREQFPES